MGAADTPNDDTLEAKPQHTNEQLETPALSPITEHGDSVILSRDTRSSSEPVLELQDGVSNARVAVNAQEQLRNAVYEGAGDAVQRESTKEKRKGSTSRRSSVTLPNGEQVRVLKLSPTQIQELTESPRSLPFRAATPIEEELPSLNGEAESTEGTTPSSEVPVSFMRIHKTNDANAAGQPLSPAVPDLPALKVVPGAVPTARPGKGPRSISSPVIQRKLSKDGKTRPQLAPLKTENEEADRLLKPSPKPDSQASPMPNIIPIPPLSLPTYLQLELSSDRPSALYIHRSANSEFPYESSKVKFDRLVNFLRLSPELERVLWFGAMACLDSWLYTFTILPLRFLKAVAILLRWWISNAAKETHDLATFVYDGMGRMRQRRRESSVSLRRASIVGDGARSRRPSVIDTNAEAPPRVNLNGHAIRPSNRNRKISGFRHRRTRSTPSALLPNHKADILQGLLVILSCMVLVQFDASRMYHSIRGQAAIKLYVIYNVLEVFDRLFSALGQDVLECLFSKETLERNADGRSKIIRPLWMFALALGYNIIHSTALFYQVVTLNVAVNSYSNALLTLLMSNQFVEIKGTVFKKFEKENLFQLTCADVVERFQLWLMLLIIALRNIVEVGGLSISLNSAFSATTSTAEGLASNVTSSRGSSIIPHAFTIFPRWTGEVLGPFLIVLGSEMLVDWLKHAYITKFNNVKPDIYGRFLDVLAKDYYSHAFVDQNLTKRLGLPVIPLSCLFIRASMQAYHMFVAMHVPLPIPSTSTSISLENEAESTSPATMAALQHIDHIFRRALGRSSFGAGSGQPGASTFSWWSLDDVIALAAMGIFFMAAYFVLLALKLVLGIALLSYARNRYKGMKERERQSVDAQGKRVGGWGVVEVDEDKRRWIYEDDPDGLRNLRERDRERGRAKDSGNLKLDAVQRYSMSAKRIW